MFHSPRRIRLLVGPIAVAALVAGCSSTPSPAAKANAERLVAETRSAGVADGLTVSAAEALYGSSAPQICDALDGGVSSLEQFLLSGNLSGRRTKVISTDAVTYGRIVVSIYCPDHLSEFDDLTSGLAIAHKS